MEVCSQNEELPAAWQAWVTALQAVLTEVLLPLFLLHFRRDCPRLPVASLAASLDAAGGRPVPGGAAGAAARLLAAACPEFVVVHEASIEDQASISLQLRSCTTGEQRTHHSAAWCAGVVAKGFSLAIPTDGDNARGPAPRDPQSKRWAQAKRDFYVDLQAIEAEFADRRADVFKQIEAYARQRVNQAPPPLSTDGVGQIGVPQHSKLDLQSIGDAVGASEAGSVLGFISELEGHADYRHQVCHIETYAARPAEYLDFEDLVDTDGNHLLSDAATAAVRQHLGIERLFRHQHSALKAVLGDKQHLCLTTGTSSGKSLAFALPILEEFRKNPSARALIIFPTKALAQDQLTKLQRLFHAVCPGLGVCTFDGDTQQSDRPSLLKNCHVFLTNPDMLHFTILAYHSRWRHVLENLRYVVLDEAHVYRAAFGTHAALLMRRFRRVLCHYRASPLFIACSATMSNPTPFFTQLLSLGSDSSVCVVDDDTAGRGNRQFCLWNPPLLESEDGKTAQQEQNARKRARFSQREGNGIAPRLPPGVGYRTRSSPYDEAAWILAQALRRGHRTVCFLQVRSMVEIVLQAAHGHLEDRRELQGRLAAYRGGYAPAERRRLEQRLFCGDLLGVVATNALELGIDVGDLDVTVHVGMPPTVASVWQQAGRAGRRGRPSVALLVAMDAPLEQHFCRHPCEFFERALESRLPDVANTILLRGHVLCAAAELAPLADMETERWFGPAAGPVLEDCRREGRLIVQPQRPQASASASSGCVLLRYCQTKGRKTPKEELSLRDIDPVQFKVLVRGNPTPLETLDQKLAFMRLHPGALYLNQRLAYFVEELDLASRIAWVVPKDPKRLDYYTECREHSQVVLSGGGLARPAALPGGSDCTSVLRCGSVTVHWRMYGFRKRAKEDHRIIDQIDLSLPPVEYPTQAVWMDLPGAVLRPIDEAGHSVDRGGLHSLEHAMIALAPLCCDLEVAELSCQHTRRDSDPNRYLLLLYESQKGGCGAASKVYAQWEMLLERAVRLLEECPCEEGCPKCIVIPHCGEYNHGLDKQAALKVGRALGFGCSQGHSAELSRRSHPPGAPKAQVPTMPPAALAAGGVRRPGMGAFAKQLRGTSELARSAVCLELD